MAIATLHPPSKPFFVQMVEKQDKVIKAKTRQELSRLPAQSPVSLFPHLRKALLQYPPSKALSDFKLRNTTLKGKPLRGAIRSQNEIQVVARMSVEQFLKQKMNPFFKKCFAFLTPAELAQVMPTNRTWHHFALEALLETKTIQKMSHDHFTSLASSFGRLKKNAFYQAETQEVYKSVEKQRSEYHAEHSYPFYNAVGGPGKLPTYSLGVFKLESGNAYFKDDHAVYRLKDVREIDSHFLMHTHTSRDFEGLKPYLPKSREELDAFVKQFHQSNFVPSSMYRNGCNARTEHLIGHLLMMGVPYSQLTKQYVIIPPYYQKEHFLWDPEENKKTPTYWLCHVDLRMCKRMISPSFFPDRSASRMGWLRAQSGKTIPYDLISNRGLIATPRTFKSDPQRVTMFRVPFNFLVTFSAEDTVVREVTFKDCIEFAKELASYRLDLEKSTYLT
jgi:hypothetical protein